tara:strand:+ start:812 stop:1183 length:372 start_codon:yes stop_codon:yes gene_type:complete
MISYLSDLITIGSQKLAGFIILILPFTSTYLTEKPEVIMLIVGFGGQALFASRFIIQWISSESVGRSIIPIGFWYCSVGGGAVMLIYAIWREDPVFICGQGLGLFIYLRNLYLIFKEKKTNGA